MGKASILSTLITTRLPESLVKLIYSGRRKTLGDRTMDAKAQAIGQFSLQFKIPGYVPTIEESRSGIEKLVDMFDEKGPDIKREEDITVGGADGDLNARLYSDSHPKDGELLPVLVYYHGGGWVQGNLDTHNGICRKLAKWASCMVISVDYRLAPEHKFPAGVMDAKAAYLWVRNNAGSLGGNPEKIGVGGDSAGGNLAAVVCQQTQINGERVPDLQMLIYPAVDGRLNSASMQELTDAYIIPKDTCDYFYGLYINGPEDITDLKFSPILKESLAGLPKTWIMTAGFDPLRDEGDDYAARLKADGVEVTHVSYPGQIHAFVNLCKAIPQGNLCIHNMADWLKTAG